LLTRIQAVYSSTAYLVPVVQRREQGFPNPGCSPSHEGIASPEAAKKHQDQPVGDNYLATNGDGMEYEFVLLSLALESSQPNIEI